MAESEIDKETTIEELRSSGLIHNRCFNALHRSNFRTLGDVLKVGAPKRDLLKLKNFGQKSLKELLDVITNNGLWPEHWVECRGCQIRSGQYATLRAENNALLRRISVLEGPGIKRRPRRITKSELARMTWQLRRVLGQAHVRRAADEAWGRSFVNKIFAETEYDYDFEEVRSAQTQGE